MILSSSSLRGFPRFGPPPRTPLPVLRARSHSVLFQLTLGSRAFVNTPSPSHSREVVVDGPDTIGELARDLSLQRWSGRDDLPFAVFANESGDIIDFPDMHMVVRNSLDVAGVEPIPAADTIPLPPSTRLLALPGRLPLAFDEDSCQTILVDTMPGIGEKQRKSMRKRARRAKARGETPEEQPTPMAVAAFLPAPFVYTRQCAYQSTIDAPPLALCSYAPVGFLNGEFVVAAKRIDDDERQEHKHRSNGAVIHRRVKAKCAEYPDNRLVGHLSTCALELGCPSAINYFMGRWEAPLPTSPTCNAQCAGCTSYQRDGEGVVAPTPRISFVPSVEEIAQVAVDHLSRSANAIVSFGELCEGEPLEHHNVLEQAIRLTRSITSRGTIHLNTNGSFPERVGVLREAGLDSMRVSVNSVRERYYASYYRYDASRRGNAGVGGVDADSSLRGGSLASARKSLRVMKQMGGFTSLDYMFFPGVTDEREEFDLLCSLLEDVKPDMIQWRNIWMDPDAYARSIEYEPPTTAYDKDVLGMEFVMSEIERLYPNIRQGFYNPCLDGDAATTSLGVRLDKQTWGRKRKGSFNTTSSESR